MQVAIRNMQHVTRNMCYRCSDNLLESNFVCAPKASHQSHIRDWGNRGYNKSHEDGGTTRDWEIAVTISPMKMALHARLGNRGYNKPHEDGVTCAIGKSRLQ